MQRYIEQIIEDLRAAKQNVPPDLQLGTEETYEEFAEKMFAIETAPNVPVKKLFGVSHEELPAAEKLTENQMKQLIDAIFDTWLVFSISAELPDGVPLKLQYELVRDQFKDDIHYMPGWYMHHDFCSGWCPDCKILNYCENVWEIWTQEELDSVEDGSFYTNKTPNDIENLNLDSDALPF